ncbi:MAG TPA: hypothetical protein VHT73_02805, partial [Thermodesulfobacteriota bacterium]|nr:hypothetical protein [Thermodesulfobacteriota bacterium]
MEQKFPLTKKPLSVWILIVANCLFGLWGTYVFLRYFLPNRPKAIEISGFPETFGIELAIAHLISGGIHLLTGFGLAKAKLWSRSAQKILAIPYFLVFP